MDNEPNIQVIEHKLNSIIDKAIKCELLTTRYKIRVLDCPQDHIGKTYSNKEKISHPHEKFVYFDGNRIFIASEVITGFMGNRCYLLVIEIKGLSDFLQLFYEEIYKNWNTKKLLEEVKLNKAEKRKVHHYKHLEQDSKALLLKEIDKFLKPYDDIYQFYQVVQYPDKEKFSQNAIVNVAQKMGDIVCKSFFEFREAVIIDDKVQISSRKSFLIFRILHEAVINRHFPATGNPLWESDQYRQNSKLITKQITELGEVINKLAIQRYSKEFLNKFCLSSEMLKLNQQLFPEQEDSHYIKACIEMSSNPPSVTRIHDDNPF